jgi:hypothetical protein
VAVVKWEGETEHTTGDLLADQLGEDERQDRDQVVSWVQDYLFHAKGRAPYGEIQAAARARGIGERALRRARKRASVEFERAGWQEGTVWVLNPDVLTELSAQNGAEPPAIEDIGDTSPEVSSMSSMEAASGPDPAGCAPA